MITKVILSISKLGSKRIIRNCSYLRAMAGEIIINNIKKCIPPLDGSSHKGQAGRIAIVGGSLEYTGAPYFAGISALRVGADLVHIFCTTPAATVIKSYSPELIVHPLLDQPQAVTEITPWLDRIHAIVIGPGLGRAPDTLKVVTDLLDVIKSKRIPLVIDADGLFLVTSKPELIKSFTSPVILTPNKIEFERLCDRMNGVASLKDFGDHITIFKKGAIDEVISCNSEAEWKSNLGGSGRRCGGQGDLLSGSMATFLHWTVNNIEKLDTKYANEIHAASLSCYAASRMIRLCNEKAFKVKGRSMLATDMIDYIHESFTDLFGQ